MRAGGGRLQGDRVRGVGQTDSIPRRQGAQNAARTLQLDSPDSPDDMDFHGFSSNSSDSSMSDTESLPLPSSEAHSSLLKSKRETRLKQFKINEFFCEPESDE